MLTEPREKDETATEAEESIRRNAKKGCKRELSTYDSVLSGDTNFLRSFLRHRAIESIFARLVNLKKSSNLRS